jgi:hypothetical protein
MVNIEKQNEVNMKKYTIALEETVVGQIEIMAGTEEEALEKACQLYKNADYVLEPGELQHAQMAIVKPITGEIEWTLIE